MLRVDTSWREGAALHLFQGKMDKLSASDALIYARPKRHRSGNAHIHVLCMCNAPPAKHTGMPSLPFIPQEGVAAPQHSFLTQRGGGGGGGLRRSQTGFSGTAARRG